jgi:hypothetical protein
VGAGQYSSVRCRSLHGYIQNVEASASNHFARPRKPAIGRKVNKKIEIALNNIERKRLNKSNPIKRREKRPPSLQELRHLWSVYMSACLLGC